MFKKRAVPLDSVEGGGGLYGNRGYSLDPIPEPARCWAPPSLLPQRGKGGWVVGKAPVGRLYVLMNDAVGVQPLHPWDSNIV